VESQGLWLKISSFFSCIPIHFPLIYNQGIDEYIPQEAPAGTATPGVWHFWGNSAFNYQQEILKRFPSFFTSSEGIFADVVHSYMTPAIFAASCRDWQKLLLQMAKMLRISYFPFVTPFSDFRLPTSAFCVSYVPIYLAVMPLLPELLTQIQRKIL